MSPLRPSDDDVIVLILVLSCVILLPTQEASPPSREHGGIKMGISNDLCDDAKRNLEVDWDFTKDFEYKCQPNELPIPPLKKTPAKVSCLDNQDIPLPIHMCMSVSIQYHDFPPRGGPHRPLWPLYGEYLYLPPQRWVHSLEHGSVVFLYHPCADRRQIKLLKKIARRCLRRHVITPYRTLSRDKPFALLTYGCKMTMSAIEEGKVVQFIKKNAFNRKRASEYDVSDNGQYSFHLIKEAKTVPGSDFDDSRLCPSRTADDSD